MKSINEPLSHVLVNHRVVGYIKVPLRKLIIVGQLAIEQQVGNFKES